MSNPPKTCAVSLAGAVAKGAFEAGALCVLAEAGIAVKHIVASSSGALNGVFYASAVRGAAEADVMHALVDIWRNEGSWHDAFALNFSDIWHGRGLSDQKGLLRLLADHVKPWPKPVVNVALDIVVSPVDGRLGQIGEQPATTYEASVSFRDSDFDSEEGLGRVFQAAVASATFPGVFAPTVVDGLGACFDGGVVNNTPLKYALQGPLANTLDVLFVISPTPLIAGPAPDLHGRALVSHLAEMLINERLYRDLSEAASTTRKLGLLHSLVPAVLSEAQLEEVKRALGWQDARNINVVQIRPPEGLEGDAFAALFHKDLRNDYIAAGELAAKRALEAL